MSPWELIQRADVSHWIRGLSLGAAAFLVLSGVRAKG